MALRRGVPAVYAAAAPQRIAAACRDGGARFSFLDRRVVGGN
jgi:hypothetical protein